MYRPVYRQPNNYNPGFQYGQRRPFEQNGYFYPEYENRSKYRINPMLYESGPIQQHPNQDPLNFSEQLAILQERDRQRWGQSNNQQPYQQPEWHPPSRNQEPSRIESNERRTQEPQGLLQQQLQQPWNQNAENQPGLNEYLREIEERRRNGK
uniref:Uncharacterized protein n=1 Tax=Panagrolaimus davidi TaxID=227884 RepID=A0A914QDM2_9BILA